MTEDQATRLFVGCIFTYSYIIPLSLLIYFYSKIIQHVREHEKTLQSQAKKMNVTSLRSNTKENETSMEIRVCKVAIGLAALFLTAWTPYAFVALTAAFGNRCVYYCNQLINEQPRNNFQWFLFYTFFMLKGACWLLWCLWFQVNYLIG